MLSGKYSFGMHWRSKIQGENKMTNQYNPKLGDVNRYENAKRLNRELADKINQEALSIVKTAEYILKKLNQIRK